jgi:hypothetical protein
MIANQLMHCCLYGEGDVHTILYSVSHLPESFSVEWRYLVLGLRFMIKSCYVYGTNLSIQKCRLSEGELAWPLVLIPRAAFNN